jgi:hypothetical protein
VGNQNYSAEEELSLANGLINVYPTTLFTVVVLDGIVVTWSHGG